MSALTKSMHRFYCPEANLSSKEIAITNKDELHHLRDVLRLKANAEVFLFDGKGREASGILLAVTSKQADIQISSVKQFRPQKPLIILACALPKKTKFEWIVEKATELGVDEIIPIKTIRTEVDLKGGRQTKSVFGLSNGLRQCRKTIVSEASCPTSIL